MIIPVSFQFSPPTAGIVGRRPGRDELCPSVHKGDAVQMAAILRYQIGDERGFPIGRKVLGKPTVARQEYSGVGQHNAPRRLNAKLVEVKIAGGVGLRGI